MTVTTNYLVTGNGITGSTANAVQALVSGAGTLTATGTQSVVAGALRNGAMIGHRGMAGHPGDSTAWRQGPFPENSLAGFKAAISAGVRVFETDVRIDSQGTAWVFHDPTVAAPGKGLITDAASNVDIRTLTTAQVKALTVKHSTASGAPGWADANIMSLDDLLGELGQDAVFLWECKATLAADAQETARVLANRLRAHGIARDRAYISSFDQSVLQAQSAYPCVRYLTTMAGRTGAQVASDAAAGAVAISADAGWDATQIALVKSYGLTTMMGSASSVRRSNRDAFLALGGDAFITDEPVYLSAGCPVILSNIFTQGRWPHGAIPSQRTQGGRGQISLDGKWHCSYLNSGGSRSTLAGWWGPIAGDWQMDFTLRWDTYATGATNAGVWISFGTSTDDSDDTTATGNNGDTGLPNRFGRGGGVVKLRRNQNYEVFRRAADGTSETLVASTGLNTALAGAGTAVTDGTDQDANKGTGTPYQFRITRVGNTISVFNITQDGAVTPKVTATDAMLGQAGYFHIARTNATWTIEGLSLTRL